MRVIVGDEDRVYRPGETFEVPAGTPHRMGTGEPTTMRWKVRRALRTAEFENELASIGSSVISWLWAGESLEIPVSRPSPLPSRCSAPG